MKWKVTLMSHPLALKSQFKIQTVVAILTELGCIHVDGTEEIFAEQSIYDFLAATMVPSEWYRFVSNRLLESFAPIEAGQTLLTGPQGDVCARHSGCLIFAPAQVDLDPGDEKEEVCFELSHRQVRQRTIRLPKWLGEGQ